MADHVATFAANLEDGTSGPAMKAADALKQLRTQLNADTKALAEMQRAMKNLQKGNVVDVETYRKLKAAIDQKSSAVAKGQQSILALGGGFGRTEPKVTKMTSLLEQLTKQSQAMPGPLGGLLANFGSLGQMLAAGAIAAGILAIVAALVALTAAATAAIVVLARYAIGQADARRAELLRLEGLTKLRFWYRATADSAQYLQTAIDDVSANSALGRDEIAKYTAQLYKMGLRGQNLKTALEGVAIKASVQGDAAASAFAGMAAGAALAGRSVKAMTDTVKARLGGIAARQMLSLEVQSRKLKESFNALFRDIKVEGLLAAVNEIQKLFSQSTVTGRALKSLLEGLIQPLIDRLTAAAPYVKRFFQGMLLGALEVGITILELRKWFRDTFDGDALDGIDGMALALTLGKVAIGSVVAAFVSLGAAIALITAPIWATVLGLYALYKVAAAVFDYFMSVDWSAVGDAIIMGMVDGLKFAAKAFLGPTMTALAKGAWGAFKSALGISSPSKEFAKLGLAIPQGVAAGVDRGAPQAQQAVGDMVQVPGGGGGAAGGGGARGPVLTIGELHFHAEGGQPRSMAEEFKRELERVLEGLAISLGAPVPGEV